MTTAPLLIELFTEELPPKALRKLGDAFANGIRDHLAKAGLVAADAPMQVFATPRRLGVLLDGVQSRAADRTETRKLMPAKVAFDASGAATPALLKRLEKEGLSQEAVGRLERRDEGGAETVFITVTLAGAELAAATQTAVQESLDKLPIPKVMTYQLADCETNVKFVRPAHGLVVLHGEQVLESVTVLGLKAGRTVHGHRFQGAKDITIASTSEYSQRLEKEGHVIASFAEREKRIEKLLIERAEETGATLGPREDYVALLDEVTALVEYPAVYVGQFETEFLEVPAECLILTMKLNQKYFPLFRDDGGLSSRFLIVSNMVMDDPRNVIHGNERVVRPRLSDARFFFETDKKTKLEDFVSKLANMVYHNKLGSQLDRSHRVQLAAAEFARLFTQHAAYLAPLTYMPLFTEDERKNAIEKNIQRAQRAALLAKADLVSLMVGEFPELQGVMGQYYALADGESSVVAHAIAEHYKPRFSGDVLPVGIGEREDLPAGICAKSLALADKLELIVGMLGIGNLPTGDKDPYGLRRQAIGVIRILAEDSVPLDLRELIRTSAKTFHGLVQLEDLENVVYEFILDRLRSYLRECGGTSSEVESLLSLRPTKLDTLIAKMGAVKQFLTLPEAAALAAANKRVANILKKSEGAIADKPSESLMNEAAERALWQALNATLPQAESLLKADDYEGYLKSFAALKSPVDAFFDQVMVNAEDAAIRANRLALLRELRDAMNRVADLSRLAA